MPLQKHPIPGQIISLHIEVGRNVCWNETFGHVLLLYHWHYVMAIAFSMVQFHLLATDFQNEVQHDFYVHVMLMTFSMAPLHVLIQDD